MYQKSLCHLLSQGFRRMKTKITGSGWWKRKLKGLKDHRRHWILSFSVWDHVLKKIELCTSAASSWSTLERLYFSRTLPDIIDLQILYFQDGWYSEYGWEYRWLLEDCDLPVKHECSCVRGGASNFVVEFAILIVRLSQRNA